MTSIHRVDAPTLETARLRLRPWESEDRAWFVALRADPEVSRFLGHGGPQSADDASAEFEHGRAEWGRIGLGGWSVEERATGIVVGYCGLPPWREGTPEEAVEIGYGYARHTWGRGYATEAAAVAIRWAFEVRDPRSVVALTHPDNLASQRVLAKLGFVENGDVAGRYGTNRVFRLQRGDFEATRAASD